jgi:hypothetical protein
MPHFYINEFMKIIKFDSHGDVKNFNKYYA